MTTMETARDGLGLGEIHMPGLGEPVNGLAEGMPDPRYQTFKSKARHSPSQSSPPTLATFVAKATSSAATLPPPAAVMPRKFSLQPSSNFSTDSISYPMIVSRSDMTGSTFSPHTPPPAPTEALVDPIHPPTADLAEASQQSRKGSKGRPTPIKISGSTHSTFLAPLLERPFMKRLGSKEKDGEREEGKEKSPTKIKSRKGSKVDSMLVDPQAILVENQFAFAQHYPPSADTVNIFDSPEKSNLPRKDSGLASSPTGVIVSVQNSSPKIDRVPVPPIDAESPRSSPKATPTPATRRLPTHSHRRAMSDESPRLKQEAAFPRAFGDETINARDRPFATFQSMVPSSPVREAERVRTGSSPSAGRAQLETGRAHGHGRSHSAAALKASKSRPEDAFFSPNSTATAINGSLISPTSVPLLSPATRRPSITPRVLDSTNSIGISVRGSVANGTATREVARAPLGGQDGVTVSLQSPSRPEDVEVGWTCISGVDSNGAPYTQWAITLKPKASAPPASAPTTARVGSSFSSYRLSSSTARPVSPPDSSRSGGEAISPFDNSTIPPQVPVPALPAASTPTRKPAATSTSSHPPTSDSQPSGSSISSESSGPTTPRRTKFGSADSMVDSVSSLDLQGPASTGRTLLMGKSKSYSNVAEQYRARQLSLDSTEGGNSSSRNGSIDSNASSAAGGPPKGIRFGKYSPAGMPLGTGSLEGFGVTLGGTEEADEDEIVGLAPFDPLDEPRTPTRSIAFVNIVPPTPDASLMPPAATQSSTSSLDQIDAGMTSSDDDEDAGRRDAAKALARGKQRMMSKWSDTEGESEAEEGDGTSWSTTPNGVEEDLVA